jgi:ribonuclease HII
MLVVGVDEAGYGPLLGPLVVAGTAFRVADDLAPRDFGKLLKKTAKAAGLKIGDSKVVYGPTKDLGALEGPVLAFHLAAASASPQKLDDLLAALGADAAVSRAAPWYRPSCEFPSRTKLDDAATAAERLRGKLADAGVEFLGLAAEVVAESRFNASLSSGNKADALFDLHCGVFERLAAARRPGEPLFVVFDRQGGRHFYAAKLQMRRADVFVSPLAESATCSDYRMHFPDAAVTLRYEVEADSVYAHVGLASMTAKYLREVFMGLFNRHFEGVCPGVAPTAGYHGDGSRWLKETRAARIAAGFPDEGLVRLS